MQASNQLKGLVESYNSVYANRQELEEAKVVAETVINSVGVCMVEQGYNESDVKEFFKTTSIAKISDVFEESLQSEGVQKHLNQETNLFETHLRYIPGAMATRIKNESPEVFSRLTLSISEGINDNPRFGVLGQIGRLGAKMFGNAKQRNAAISYEKSKNDIDKRRGQGPNTSTATANEIAAETKGRRKADPNYKPGQGVGSGSNAKATPKAEPKAEPKSRIDTTITKAKPAAPVAKPAAPVVKPVKTVKVDGKKMTDAQIRAEYDKKRYSKDPKVKASAKDFGMKASKARFGTAGTKDFGDKRESAELDLVLQHLVSEGIADTLQGALVMVEGMSDQFINSIIEQAQMGSAMVEFLIQNGEAETIEEAQYIISELDEENIDLLIQSITEGGMTLLGGKRGYVRYGGPEKKGDQKVSGIGPFGTYARKSEGSTGGTKTKSQTMKMTSDGKPRKY